MVGERGWCQVWISLTPTVPSRIQALEIESTLPPSPVLQTAADQLAALTAKPMHRALARLCAAGLDQAALWDQLRLVNILCGPCSVGDVTGGDGATWASFQFIGSKGCADARLQMDERGKLVDARFS